MFQYAIQGCWENLETGSTPTSPVLTWTDDADGTGGTATKADDDGGTVNTLFTIEDGGTAFTSQGSTWVGDDKAVTLSVGTYWGYVRTVAGTGTSVSNLLRFTVTNSDTTTNGDISDLIETMGEQVTLQKPTEITRTETGARSKPTWATHKSSHWVWIQDATAGTVVEKGKRKIIITHKVYTATDPVLEEGYRILTADTRYLVIYGGTNAAQQDGLWKLLCAETQ